VYSGHYALNDIACAIKNTHTRTATAACCRDASEEHDQFSRSNHTDPRTVPWGNADCSTGFTEENMLRHALDSLNVIYFTLRDFSNWKTKLGH